MKDEIITTSQAAELLQVSIKTVKAMAAAGDIPARKLGRQWRFSKQALIAHMEGEK